MSREKKAYTDGFKKQIVALHQNGKSAKDIGKEYGVSKTSIYEWKSMLRSSGSLRIRDNLTEEQKQLKELEKENKQLRMEIDILKQAALIMAKR